MCAIRFRQKSTLNRAGDAQPAVAVVVEVERAKFPESKRLGGRAQEQPAPLPGDRVEYFGLLLQGDDRWRVFGHLERRELGHSVDLTSLAEPTLAGSGGTIT